MIKDIGKKTSVAFLITILCLLPSIFGMVLAFLDNGGRGMKLPPGFVRLSTPFGVASLLYAMSASRLDATLFTGLFYIPVDLVIVFFFLMCKLLMPKSIIGYVRDNREQVDSRKIAAIAVFCFLPSIIGFILAFLYNGGDGVKLPPGLASLAQPFGFGGPEDYQVMGKFFSTRLIVSIIVSIVYGIIDIAIADLLLFCLAIYKIMNKSLSHPKVVLLWKKCIRFFLALFLIIVLALLYCKYDRHVRNALITGDLRRARSILWDYIEKTNMVQEYASGTFTPHVGEEEYHGEFTMASPIDQWNNEFLVSILFLDGRLFYSVRSAGPDKIFYTKDDLIERSWDRAWLDRSWEDPKMEKYFKIPEIEVLPFLATKKDFRVVSQTGHLFNKSGKTFFRWFDSSMPSD